MAASGNRRLTESLCYDKQRHILVHTVRFHHSQAAESRTGFLALEKTRGISRLGRRFPNPMEVLSSSSTVRSDRGRLFVRALNVAGSVRNYAVVLYRMKFASRVARL
jgi:hypothetical protein